MTWENSNSESYAPETELYRISPIGAGTENCEGLNSYLIRLAGEHSVNVRDLIRGVLLPADARMLATQKPGFNHQAASTLNGLGPYARAFTETLNCLTGRDDLNRLTLLPLASVLTDNGPGLMAKDRRWCPECLVAMIRASGNAYQPLAWSFELYRVCVMHGAALVDRCPRCSRRQPFIPRYPTVMHCAFCKQTLFSDSIAFGEPLERPAADRWEMWISRAIEGLVRFTSSTNETDLLPRLMERIGAIIRQIGEGTLRQFYLRTGLPMGMCKHWMNRGEKPTLPQLLRFCRAVGVMPDHLLASSDERLAPGRPPADVEYIQGAPIVERVRRIPPHEDLKREIARAITGAIRAEGTTNVTDLARAFDTTPTALRYWFPREYARLCDRARARRTESQRALQDQKIHWATHFASQLASAGFAPSKHRIEEGLKEKNLTLRGEGISRRVTQQCHSEIGDRRITYTNKISDVHKPDGQLATSVTHGSITRRRK